MTKTTVEPMELFNLIKHVPSLFEEFRRECYTVPLEEALDANPEKKYDHNLGLAFLKKHGIPSTREDLFEDGKYTYSSVMTGSIRYNVGQLVVLFSDTIYSSGDMTTGNTWILEVMDEFEFPGNIPLVSLRVEDIRLALASHIEKGTIKLHQAAGIRMYDNVHTYGYAERINSEAKLHEQKE